MAEVSLLLWDMGGVILSNGWDESDRENAARHFGLDAAELERRHQGVVDAFETGKLDLKGYLASIVFYAPRPFSPETFREWMWSASTEISPTIEIARMLRSSERYLMVALNNESRELNEYRIAKFGLKELFHLFLSSCYTGRRKPDPESYRFALGVAQRAPSETLFLDDRPENIEAAAQLGIRTILVGDPVQLRRELVSAGIAVG